MIYLLQKLSFRALYFWLSHFAEFDLTLQNSTPCGLVLDKLDKIVQDWYWDLKMVVLDNLDKNWLDWY